MGFVSLQTDDKVYVSHNAVDLDLIPGWTESGFGLAPTAADLREAAPDRGRRGVIRMMMASRQTNAGSTGCGRALKPARARLRCLHDICD